MIIWKKKQDGNEANEHKKYPQNAEALKVLSSLLFAGIEN